MSRRRRRTDTGRAAPRWRRRLREAYDDLWDAFVDPSEAFLDTDGQWWEPLVDRDTYAGPAFATAAQQQAIVAQCRRLSVENEFAINGHENRISFVIGAGHVYRCRIKRDSPAPQRLAEETQRMVDEFLLDNDWHRRQQEIVRRRDRDGEVFLRLFLAPDGRVRVRFVEPAQVAAPPDRAGDAACSFGVWTDADDVETVRAYFVDGEAVDADRVQHRKANVDGNVKRGLPLYYPVRKNLRRAEKLLRNMSIVAEIQSAIALVRRHRGGTSYGVQQFVAGRADAKGSNPATGRTSFVRRYGPGTILDASGEIDYEFPAAQINAAALVGVLQAELRAIAARLVMPEFMLTSDASNANYASTMVAEGPAVRMFQRLQAEQMADDRALLRRVVAEAAAAGKLDRAALEEVEITAAAPSPAVRDELREAQVHRIEHERGLLSPQTWSQRRGLDYEQEQRNWAQHRAVLARFKP